MQGLDHPSLPSIIVIHIPVIVDHNRVERNHLHNDESFHCVLPPHWHRHCNQYQRNHPPSTITSESVTSTTTTAITASNYRHRPPIPVCRVIKKSNRPSNDKSWNTFNPRVGDLVSTPSMGLWIRSQSTTGLHRSYWDYHGSWRWRCISSCNSSRLEDLIDCDVYRYCWINYGVNH